MKTVFSDLSLDIDVDNVEAMKQLAPVVDDAFVIHTILTNLANRNKREGYRQVICTLTPKVTDPVVLVYCVSHGLYDGMGQDLEMFVALDNRIGAFQSTSSCLALIASHLLGLPGSQDIRSYIGRAIDHCLKSLPEGLIYELGVKHELPAGPAFWILVPYLSPAHRAQILTETDDMEKAWWIIRNFTNLTNLMLVRSAIKSKRVRASVDAYIHGNTIEE